MARKKKAAIEPLAVGSALDVPPLMEGSIGGGPFRIEPGPLNAGLPVVAAAPTISAGTLPFMGVG